MKNNATRSKTPLFILVGALALFLILFRGVEPILNSGGAPGLLARVFQVTGFLILCLLFFKLLISVHQSLSRAAYEREAHRRAVSYWKRLEKRLIEVEEDIDKPAWGGFRKFRVVKKIEEAVHVFSFHLAPHDRKAIPEFLPGQYLTFQLKIPDAPRPMVRCYSLSDCAGKDYFRVTIKKLLTPPDKPDHPPGVASCFFGDRISSGDILDVKAPAGQFHLDVKRENPVVFIGGGVGVTPLVSMLNAAVEKGSRREIHFFYGVVDGSQHIFKSHLETIAAAHDNVRLHVCYSQPREKDVEGKDYHFKGWVSVDLMKSMLPSNNYHFYICGPPPMMDSITQGLEAWGVPGEAVHFESFGPATIKKVARADADARPLDVHFKKSGKTLSWTPQAGALLDMAEQNGIFVDSGCRTGNCGACLVAVRSGTFEYLHPPGAPQEEGSCLTCIATPKSEMELDA